MTEEKLRDFMDELAKKGIKALMIFEHKSEWGVIGNGITVYPVIRGLTSLFKKDPELLNDILKGMAFEFINEKLEEASYVDELKSKGKLN